MKLAVEHNRSASLDHSDIVDWIARHVSVDNAFYVLDGSHAVVQSLSLMPQRGAVSSELRSLGIGRYREIFCRATNTEKLRGRWYRDDEKALATAQRAGKKSKSEKYTPESRTGARRIPINFNWSGRKKRCDISE